MRRQSRKKEAASLSKLPPLSNPPKHELPNDDPLFVDRARGVEGSGIREMSAPLPMRAVRVVSNALKRVMPSRRSQSTQRLAPLPNASAHLPPMQVNGSALGPDLRPSCPWTENSTPSKPSIKSAQEVPIGGYDLRPSCPWADKPLDKAAPASRTVNSSHCEVPTLSSTRPSSRDSPDMEPSFFSRVDDASRAVASPVGDLGPGSWSVARTAGSPENHVNPASVPAETSKSPLRQAMGIASASEPSELAAAEEERAPTSRSLGLENASAALELAETRSCDQENTEKPSSAPAPSTHANVEASAPYYVNQEVEMRDEGDSKWQRGVVTELEPRVLVRFAADPTTPGVRWSEVRPKPEGQPAVAIFGCHGPRSSLPQPTADASPLRTNVADAVDNGRPEELPGYVNNETDDAPPSPLRPSVAIAVEHTLELPGAVNSSTDALSPKPPEVATAQDELKRRVHEAFLQQCDRGMTPTTAAIGAIRRCTMMPQRKRSKDSAEESVEMDVDALKQTCNKFSYETFSPTNWSVATC